MSWECKNEPLFVCTLVFDLDCSILDTGDSRRYVFNCTNWKADTTNKLGAEEGCIKGRQIVAVGF